MAVRPNPESLQLALPNTETHGSTGGRAREIFEYALANGEDGRLHSEEFCSLENMGEMERALKGPSPSL